jgi:hypothetical protein
VSGCRTEEREAVLLVAVDSRDLPFRFRGICRRILIRSSKQNVKIIFYPLVHDNRKNTAFFKGSQASSACTSGKRSPKKKLPIE